MFRITVTEHKQIEKPQREWQKLTDNPEAETQYGYGPEIVKTVKEERTVFSQEAQAVDIVALQRTIAKANK